MCGRPLRAARRPRPGNCRSGRDDGGGPYRARRTRCRGTRAGSRPVQAALRGWDRARTIPPSERPSGTPLVRLDAVHYSYGCGPRSPRRGVAQRPPGRDRRARGAETAAARQRSPRSRRDCWSLIRGLCDAVRPRHVPLAGPGPLPRPRDGDRGGRSRGRRRPGARGRSCSGAVRARGSRRAGIPATSRAGGAGASRRRGGLGGRSPTCSSSTSRRAVSTRTARPRSRPGSWSRPTTARACSSRPTIRCCPRIGASVSVRPWRSPLRSRARPRRIRRPRGRGAWSGRQNDPADGGLATLLAAVRSRRRRIRLARAGRRHGSLPDARRHPRRHRRRRESALRTGSRAYSR